MFHTNPEIFRELTRNHERTQRRMAEQYRLVRGTSAPHNAVYRPLLVTLGKRMVSWGTNLQARYTECTEAIESWRTAEPAPASQPQPVYVRK